MDKPPVMEPVGDLDVSGFASRMGMGLPVFVERQTFKEYVARAKDPDRDTFVILSSALDVISAASETEAELPPVLPFFYDSKRRDSAPNQVRLYIYLFAYEETGEPWLLISSVAPQNRQHPELDRALQPPASAA